MKHSMRKEEWTTRKRCVLPGASTNKTEDVIQAVLPGSR